MQLDTKYPTRETNKGSTLSIVDEFNVDGVIYFTVYCSACSKDTELHIEPFIQPKK